MRRVPFYTVINVTVTALSLRWSYTVPCTSIGEGRYKDRRREGDFLVIGNMSQSVICIEYHAKTYRPEEA